MDQIKQFRELTFLNDSNKLVKPTISMLIEDKKSDINTKISKHEIHRHFMDEQKQAENQDKDLTIQQILQNEQISDYVYLDHFLDIEFNMQIDGDLNQSVQHRVNSFFTNKDMHANQRKTV